MARKTAARREELRKTLIKIAAETIEKDGLGALRARDLAKEAGCATGAIYNVFEDLNELALAVNAITFKRLGTAVASDLAKSSDDPATQLTTMGHAYHKFAAENYHMWRAIFDVSSPADAEVPDWYRSEMETLLGIVGRGLATAFPEMPTGERALLARALFSSVHGIVSLGLDAARISVPADQIDAMISLLLRQVTTSA